MPLQYPLNRSLIIVSFAWDHSRSCCCFRHCCCFQRLWTSAARHRLYCLQRRRLRNSHHLRVLRVPVVDLTLGSPGTQSAYGPSSGICSSVCRGSDLSCRSIGNCPSASLRTPAPGGTKSPHLCRRAGTSAALPPCSRPCSTRWHCRSSSGVCSSGHGPLWTALYSVTSRSLFSSSLQGLSWGWPKNSLSSFKWYFL